MSNGRRIKPIKFYGGGMRRLFVNDFINEAFFGYFAKIVFFTSLEINSNYRTNFVGDDKIVRKIIFTK